MTNSNKIPYKVPLSMRPDGGSVLLLSPEEVERCKQIERTIKATERRELLTSVANQPKAQ